MKVANGVNRAIIRETIKNMLCTEHACLAKRICRIPWCESKARNITPKQSMLTKYPSLHSVTKIFHKRS